MKPRPLHLPTLSLESQRDYNCAGLGLLAYGTNQALVVRYIHSLFLLGGEAIVTLIIYASSQTTRPVHRLKDTETTPVVVAHFAISESFSRKASFDKRGISF